MPEAEDWSLIRETPTLLGVVKPAGLLSVPGRGPSKADCLIARVQQRFPEARIVHRLDQATSGVMVLARSAESHRALGWQFERREVSKRYVAIVAGHVEQDEGEIDAPLRKALADGPRHVVDPIHGKPAITRWRVVERTTLGA
ncbi:MAG: RluA family pseudouridine synthase, partial [Phycisphaerales bacterium]